MKEKIIKNAAYIIGFLGLMFGIFGTVFGLTCMSITKDITAQYNAMKDVYDEDKNAISHLSFELNRYKAMSEEWEESFYVCHDMLNKENK